MQKRISLDFFSSHFFVWILIFPFFKPTVLSYVMPLAEQILEFWKLASAVAILIIYIREILANHKISILVLLSSLFFIALLFSTVYNNGNTWISINQYSSLIAVCMFTEVCIKRNCKVFIRTIFVTLFILVLINYILFFAYPNGIVLTEYYYYPCNFLDIDNLLAPIFISELAIALIAYEIRIISFKWLIAAYFITLHNIVLVWSATGVVGVFLMLIYFLFVYHKSYSPALNPAVLFPIYPIFTFLIIFFNIQDTLSFVIVDILNKSVDMTGRISIWNTALDLIKNSPIIGYGSYDFGGFIFWKGKLYHAHNSILEVMLRGGVVSLTIWAMLIFFVGKILFKLKKHCIANIITFSLFAIMVTMLTEVYISQIWFYLLLAIGAGVPSIVEQCKTEIRSQKVIWDVPNEKNTKQQHI